MDGRRLMTWDEFQESLDNMEEKTIMYMDEEGSEIPINTDAEFQEALRLAKRQGNRVRFILLNESYDEGKRSNRQNSKSKEKYPYKDGKKDSKGWENDGGYKEVKEAVYANDTAPEWFLSYMKKFKKDLLAEVNNTVNDAIHKAFKKEIKFFDERLARDYDWDNASYDMNYGGTQYYYKSEGGYETPAYFVANQSHPASGSGRMKSADKLCCDQMIRDDRRGKQNSKMEKGRLTLDKRAKPDRWMNVISNGNEEKQKSPKLRPYPKVYLSYLHDFGPIKPMKSASFTSNLSLKRLEVFQPYALWFLLGNNGSVPFSNKAYVKCFYNPDEFYLEEDVVELPTLNPGVGANVVYEVTPLKVGSCSFTCAIIDGGEEIGERILCRFDVVDLEEVNTTKARKASVKKETQPTSEQYEDEVTKTQKKIRDNIKTIMKRLDDIEILNSEPGSKGDSKKKEDDSVKVGQKRNRKKRKEGTTVSFRTGVFDLLQNLESIRENEEGKPKNGEEEIVKDTLVGAEDKGDKKEKQSENGNKSQDDDAGSDCSQLTNADSKKEAAETDKRDSDSELSVIMGSEEDDNFIVLSIPSKTPSPETEVKELENDKDEEKDKDNDKEDEKEKVKEKENEKEKEGAPKERRSDMKRSVTFGGGFIFDPWNEKKNGESTPLDPWKEKWGQFDPFDDVPKVNEKRKWSNVHVINVPEGSQTSKCFFFDTIATPEEMWSKIKEKGMLNKEVTLGDKKMGANVVFVVDGVGKCVPVVHGKSKEGGGAAGKQQESAEAKENKKKENQGESSNATPPEGSTTGGEQLRERCSSNQRLYSATFGATTKAKSAFSSIHSAFLPVVKKKKTLLENNSRPLKMMEALKALEDMGFKDRIRNRELLMVHKLNMTAVIENLLDKTPNFRDNPPTGIFVSKQGVFGRI